LGVLQVNCEGLSGFNLDSAASSCVAISFCVVISSCVSIPSCGGPGICFRIHTHQQKPVCVVRECSLNSRQCRDHTQEALSLSTHCPLGGPPGNGQNCMACAGFKSKNKMLALAVCFAQQCSSAGRTARFSAYRSRLDYRDYQPICSFPQTFKTNSMKCFVN